MACGSQKNFKKSQTFESADLNQTETSNVSENSVPVVSKAVPSPPKKTP